ncbi:MAG: TonB-dependent receptor [Opitutaceae bacterium]|nr:TonB-dependent receptor [Opitutaceae bacterium]
MDTTHHLLRASLTWLVCGPGVMLAASLTGYVRDATNNSPLPNAAVAIVELARETTTTTAGRYSFAEIPPGEYTLRASYAGLDDATQRVRVTGSDENQAELKLGAEIVKLGAFVVEGERQGQARALQMKRSSAGIMDAVAADAMGKFPDGNAAEALRRMPGVSVEIDQDEGRYVVVRGIDSALNNVTLNNQLIGTPSEAGNRGVAMDSVPADLIARLEVTKAVTPDMDGTAIGGAINIVTQSAFDRPEGFLFGSASGFYDDFSGRTSPNGSITFGRVLDRAGKWGLVVGASYSKKEFKSQTSDTPAWTLLNDIWTPLTQESFDYDIMRARMGANVALQFRPKAGHDLALRLNHNQFTDEEDRQKTNFEHVLGVRTNHSALGGTSSQGRATREFRSYHQTGSIRAVSLEGTHQLIGGYQLNWQAGASEGERDVPKRDDWEYRSSSGAFPNSYSLASGRLVVTPNAAFYNPASYPFRRVRFRSDLERERVLSFQTDLRREISLGSKSGYWKAGAKFVSRDKADDRTNRNYNLLGPAWTLAETGLAGAEPSNYFDGRYRFGPTINLPANEAFFTANPGRFAFDPLGSLNNSLAGDFDATEEVLAAYGMASVNLSTTWNALAGVRYEHTTADYAANALSTPGGTFSGVFRRVAGTNRYDNLMPGIHLVWRPNKRLVGRIAWTNTLARPNYTDLAPRRVVDDIETSAGSGRYTGSISTGNSHLKPYKASNLDLSLEYYLKGGGIVSVGIFNKDIDNPVYGGNFVQTNVVIDGRNYDRVVLSQPENAKRGQITGAELNYQQFLTALPSPFDGFGVNLNYTVTDSSATLFTRADKLPFFKQSDEVGNFALLFEKYGFEARVAMAFTSPYLTAVGASAATDTYTERRRPIDAKVSYRINKRFRVFAEFLNLNEESLDEYTGVAARNSGNEIYHWKSRFGVSFNQ